MFIYLGLNLIAVKIIDLADFHSGRDGLPEDHVQKSEFTVNRRLDGKIVLAAADHEHILAHIVQALLHLLNFHAPVEAVLLRPLLDKLEFPCGKLVVLPGRQIFLPGNQLVLIQGLVLPIFAPQSRHLCLELELVLPQ